MEYLRAFIDGCKVFLDSALRIAQAGTAFSYFMWFLLFILGALTLFIIIKLKLYLIPVLPILILSKFFEMIDGIKDSDGDGIRNKKDKDRNGDGILDKFQSKKYVRRNK